MSPSASVYSIVNTGLAHFYIQIFNNLMSSFGYLLHSLVTLYVVYVGFTYAMGEKEHRELMELLKSGLLVVAVSFFAFDSQLYFKYIIKPFVQQLTDITSFLLSNISSLHDTTAPDTDKAYYFSKVGTLKQLFTSLDAMFLDFIKACTQLLPGSWTEILSANILFNLLGVAALLFAFGAMYTGFAIIFIMSYFVMWLLFYVGAIAMLLGCFKATRGIFFSWLRQIANQALIIIFTTVVVAVCYNGVSVSVYTMTQYDSSMWTFTEDFLSLICWCFVCLAITLKTPDIAAAFTQQMAGATSGIAGAISTAGGTATALGVSGSALTGRHALSFGKIVGGKLVGSTMNAYERLKNARGAND
jgi:type IV secretory pathway VirB6-like protein